MAGKNELSRRRAARVRRALRARAGKGADARARLTVFRSSKNIYAQVIDDAKGHTIVAASTLEKDLKGRLKTGADKAAAAEIGKLIAERAKAAGIEKVYFDRGAYGFHGRVKALADGAREGGLSF
jgi:large subunit ribosomal protein L18